MICQHCHLNPLKRKSFRASYNEIQTDDRFVKASAEYLVTMLDDVGQVVLQTRLCHTHKQRILRELAPVESPNSKDGIRLYFHPEKSGFHVQVVAYSDANDGEEARCS